MQLDSLLAGDDPTRPIVLLTTDWCMDCHRVKFLLDEYGVAYEAHDVEQDAAALAIVMALNNGRRRVPTIIFADGDVMVEPSSAQLMKKLDLAW